MKNDSRLYKALLAQFVLEDDPLLAMLKWIMNEMMKIELENKLGAKKGEHSKERKGYLSGYRARRFDTRLGSVYLLIPKVRKGGYIPFFLTEKQRSEQALISLVREAYINGVSSRRITKITKSLGIENISASQVSEINKGLDEQVESFRNRKLEAEYPFIWVDAVYEKIRDYDNKVVSYAFMTAMGINVRGKKELLAIEPFNSESTETWKAFFNKLKDRGLKRINLIISDAHQGIQQASKECFLNSSWQRCKVHFMRNILKDVPKRAKRQFAYKLKQIFLQDDKQAAIDVAEQLNQNYSQSFPKALITLEQGLEDSLQFYHFPNIDKNRISSTNCLERLNKEIRRRSRVVAVFPSVNSYLRLISSYLMEYTEDWEIEKSYVSISKLEEVIKTSKPAA